MQIDSLEVFHLALPWRRAINSPWGEFTSLETVLVRISSGGTAGWGEATPGNAPLYGSEWAGGVFACVKDWLGPTVAGQYIESAASLQERLSRVRGNQHAKAAVDTAWWDLRARLEGKPLHRCLGGSRDRLEVGTSFDQMDSIDEFLDAIGRAFAGGFSRVELKLRPGWDVNMLNAVRHLYPVETIHADVEGGMRLEHMELLCRMDDFSLAMVEQPLPADDLVGHAMVQETIKTPVCLAESITTVDQAEMALELESGKYVDINPGRVGGITPAIAIHDKCHDACTPCWVGGTPQSAIGRRIGLALAAKNNFTYPTDWFNAAELLEHDLAPPPVIQLDPSDNKLRVHLWSEPGIGIDPDPELLEKHTLACATLRP